VPVRLEKPLMERIKGTRQGCFTFAWNYSIAALRHVLN